MEVLAERDKPVRGPDYDGLSLLPLLGGQPIPDTLQKRILFQNYHLSTLAKPAALPGGTALQWPFKMAEDSLLFNLQSDPSESRNVASIHPEKLRILREAYQTWWQSLPRQVTDYPLAIPIGYEQENPILLQPHHGKSIGKLQFLGSRGLLGERIGAHPSGVDGDWLGAWEKVEDGIRWMVDVSKPGRYHIGVQVRNSLENEELNLQLKIAGDSVVATIPGLRAEHAWREFQLLDLELPQGLDTLSVTLQPPLAAKNGFDMRGLSLRLSE